MKNLFATASYTFNNFYNNLNTSGQMIFSVIMFLIIILCILLFITYVIEEVKSKLRIKRLKKEAKNSVETSIKTEEKDTGQTNFDDSKTDIKDIANAISDALQEENKPISLTDFEEEEEKTAIISIDELMQKAKELHLIEDEENEGINYLEKYNLGPAEVSNTGGNSEEKKEVKAFKVSQVISPIYGVKKEVIDGGNK